MVLLFSTASSKAQTTCLNLEFANNQTEFYKTATLEQLHEQLTWRERANSAQTKKSVLMDAQKEFNEINTCGIDMLKEEINKRNKP